MINSRKLSFTTLFQKRYFRALIFALMIISAALNFWLGTDFTDSEGLVVSGIAAAKHDIDLGERRFGLGRLTTPLTDDPYELYDNRKLFDQGYEFQEYPSQLGLQGWVFYLFAKFIPSPVAAFRLANSIIMAVVISLISFEVFKKYGLIFASSFYFVTVFSIQVRDFAPNLYWMEFTWFLPMLLGLICLNRLDQRRWLYPLFYLAFLIKFSCGYEFTPVVILGAVMFLGVEWLLTINRDRKRQQVLLRTILVVIVLAVLAFATAITIQAYLRGDGNLSDGFTAIYQKDVTRRTFGNADDFPGVYKDSLNASVLDVLGMYLWEGPTGKAVVLLLAASLAVIVYRSFKDKKLPRKEIWLLLLSFLTSTAWFVLGKSHSYIHIDLNAVMWYMGYMQTSVYIVANFVFFLVISNKGLQRRAAGSKAKIDEKL